MMDVEEVKVLLEKKYTYSRIGEMYGKTRNSVATFVRRRVHGIPWDYVGPVASFRAGIPSAASAIPSKQKGRRGRPPAVPRPSPTLPYVPGVTEDGKRVRDDD